MPEDKNGQEPSYGVAEDSEEQKSNNVIVEGKKEQKSNNKKKYAYLVVLGLILSGFISSVVLYSMTLFALNLLIISCASSVLLGLVSFSFLYLFANDSKDLKKTRGELQEKSQEIENLEANIKEHLTKEENFNKERQEAEQDKNTKEQDLQRQLEEIEKLKTDKQAFEAELAKQKGLYNKLTSSLSGINETINEVNQSEIKSVKKEFKKEKEELQSKIEEQKTTISQLNEEKEELQKELQSQKTLNEELEAKLSEQNNSKWRPQSIFKNSLAMMNNSVSPKQQDEIDMSPGIGGGSWSFSTPKKRLFFSGKETGVLGNEK